MTERQTKALRIRKLIQRRMFELFMDNDVLRAVRLIDRLNAVTRIVYSGQPLETPGTALDSFIADRVFNSRF